MANTERETVSARLSICTSKLFDGISDGIPDAVISCTVAMLTEVALKNAKPKDKLSDSGGLQFWGFPDGTKRWRLEHVPQKWRRFFDRIMLQHIESERVLVAWMIPSKRNAL